MVYNYVWIRNADIRGIFCVAFLKIHTKSDYNCSYHHYSHTIEYDEVRFHERHDSIISAVRSFATKLASAVDQAVVALILIISNIYAISQKNIIDERKYEELVAEIKSTNKK